MTDPKGNGEFCFLRDLHCSRCEAEGNMELEGKQNSPFPAKLVIKCFIISVPTPKKKEKLRKKSFA